ncbi:hypothetical protein JCM10212_006191 [Sporobolomyces blumeae]
MDTSSVFQPAHAARDTAALLGPQAAAWQVSFVLWGIFLILHLQYTLSPTYSRHSFAVRVTSWVVFVLVGIFNVLAFVNNFHWMVVINRSTYTIFIGWPLDFVFPSVTGATGFIVQAFLALRASVLIRNRKIRIAFLGALGLTILTSLVFSLLTTASGFMYFYGTPNKIVLDYNKSAALWLWTSASADVAISVSLYFTLKQRLGHSAKTDSILRKLILTALQTASYTSVLAVTGAIVSLIFKVDQSSNALLHFAFWMPLPGCYALSLHTTLATRRTIDQHLTAATALSPEPEDLEAPTQAFLRSWGCGPARLSEAATFRPALVALAGEKDVEMLRNGKKGFDAIEVLNKL